MKTYLYKLHEINVRAVSFTCDGPRAHFAMAQSLGAFLHFDDFEDPSDASRVYFILDVIHMLKLVRTTLGKFEMIWNV